MAIGLKCPGALLSVVRCLEYSTCMYSIGLHVESFMMEGLRSVGLGKYFGGLVIGCVLLKVLRQVVFEVMMVGCNFYVVCCAVTVIECLVLVLVSFGLSL